MTYTLIANSSSVIRDADGAMIPNDPKNSDWSVYQGWVAAGNTPNPAASLPPPQWVTDKQFFQAAAQTGIITQDEAVTFMANGAIPSALATAISQLPAGEQFAAKMAIIGARNFYRADPLVIALSAAMGQTSAQVDTLFTLAATL